MTHDQQSLLSLGIITGSLRTDSVTKQLARTLAEIAPAIFSPTFIEIGDLPLYNEDLDIEVRTEPPAAWARFRNHVSTCDAILFVTPEYNRSVPAPLKNAVDVGSAPHEHNAFAGIPAAIVSASPGRMGAFGANHHLRQSLVFLNMPTMQQPELYLGESYDLFHEDGTVRDPAVEARLREYMTHFAHWAALHNRVAV